MENKTELSEKKPSIKINTSTIFILTGFLIGIYFLLPQVGEIEKTIRILTTAKYQWIILALFLQFLTYFAGALSLIGVVDYKLPFGVTALEQLAGTFLSILTPQGLGKVALDEYYLEGFGIERARAISAVMMSYVANLIVRILLPLILLLTISFLAHSKINLSQINLPNKWQYLLGIVGILISLGVLLILFSPNFLKRKLLVSGTSIIQNIKMITVTIIKKPIKGLQLLGGSLAFIILDSATLLVCLHAFGVNPPFIKVLIVLLESTIISTLSPTPGGAGAVEAFLAIGLTAIGITLTQAIAGILTFRLLSFWLPLLPGYVAYNYFRRKQMI